MIFLIVVLLYDNNFWIDHGNLLFDVKYFYAGKKKRKEKAEQESRNQ